MYAGDEPSSRGAPAAARVPASPPTAGWDGTRSANWGAASATPRPLPLGAVVCSTQRPAGAMIYNS